MKLVKLNGTSNDGCFAVLDIEIEYNGAKSVGKLMLEMDGRDVEFEGFDGLDMHALVEEVAVMIEEDAQLSKAYSDECSKAQV